MNMAMAMTVMCARSFPRLGLCFQSKQFILPTPLSSFIANNTHLSYLGNASSPLAQQHPPYKYSNTIITTSQYHVLNAERTVFKKDTMVTILFRTYSKKGKDKGKKGGKKVVLTSEQLEGILDSEKLHQELDHVVEDLKDKYVHQVTVRTSQGVFDNMTIKTPDGNFPLIQLAQIIQKSAQMIAINMAAAPQYITHVKNALSDSGLNINPQQDGTSLFVPLPKVTREHRETLAKNAKVLSEKSKKQLREIYSKYSKKIKASKEHNSSDDMKAADDMVKDWMHEKMEDVEAMTTAKQKELLGGK